MKKTISLIITLLLFCMASAYSQKEKKLEGVWIMIHSKWDLPDTIIERTQFTVPSYKIFVKPHFSMSRWDENGEFGGHFGTYEFDGENYIEHIKYSSYGYLVGVTEEFKCTLEGDELKITGKIGNSGEGFLLVETWQRIE